MSFVTTPPELLASVPSMTNAWSLAGGSPGYPDKALEWAAIGGWSGSSKC
jgi:hypothetical protein